ncbi:MAG: hypothetical protein HON40_03870 [Flavobacteriales bacterium]|nr:hypothetical protein [Flavobacteriales bacterium]
MKKIILIFSVFLFTSCTTYLMPIESFEEQFQNVNESSREEVKVRTPYYGISTKYLANTINNITCFDKNNNSIILKNSPSIEIRITEKNEKKTIFYFDRVYQENSIVYGDKSRIPGFEKGIPLDSILKIEIQDGKKNFKYIENDTSKQQ